MLLEIASDSNSDRPDLVDIKKLAGILMPEIKTETEF